MTVTERPLSHWGWGYADRFPGVDERKNIAQMVAALVVTAPREPHEPVSLEDATLPAAAEVDLPGPIAAIARSDRAARASHTWGRAFPDIVRGFHGDFSAAPDLVLCPESEDQVVSVLSWAADRSVAVIPFGGGTSVVGGIEGRVDRTRYRAVASLDMRAMDQVLEVKPGSLLARIQAGASGPVLERQLATHGLTLRHFPQSFELSTLGGWIATRAGGHYATLHTHIDERVASLRMVTPTGVYESRTLPGSGAGPSPDRSLAIGSEGIMGVITEAWMRVVRRPTFRARASVRFKDYGDAVAATRAIAQSGLYPANCRLLDAREAMLFGVSLSGESILLVAFESADHPVESGLERALAIAAEAGGVAYNQVVRNGDEPAGESNDGGDHGSWRDAFINAPYLLNTMVSLGMVSDTFETACTWDGFEALHADVIKSVRGAMKATCGGGLISCRFTHVYPDGPAPYYTFVAPGRRDGQVEQWQAIKRAASDALMRHQATITHHHAVGRTHRPWYDQQRPDPFARALRAAKAELDPRSILNPGVLIDPV